MAASNNDDKNEVAAPCKPGTPTQVNLYISEIK